MEKGLLIFFLLTAGGFLWLNWIEPNWFHLRRLVVRVKKPIPKPLSILHLSDFHFTRRRFFLSRFFDRLARLDLDFVFLTGDLIDGRGGIGPLIEGLSKLKPKKGIYAVLGNHDYEHYPLLHQLLRLFTGKIYGLDRSETRELKKALRRGGVRLLINENIPIQLDGREAAVIVGIDDPVTGRADFNEAFRGIQDDVLHLALIHSPATFPSLSQRGIDIAFAGHTHGGQIRLPGLGPIPYAYRLEPIIDSTNRYGFSGLVSRGMGAGPFFRFRLFCRPEALLVRIEGAL